MITIHDMIPGNKYIVDNKPVLCNKIEPSFEHRTNLIHISYLNKNGKPGKKSFLFETDDCQFGFEVKSYG